MAVLSNKFDILRGWPNASAVAEDFIIPNKSAIDNLADSHKFLQGQWVTLKSTTDGTMACEPLIADVDSGPSKPCYLIIEGRDDYSSQFANRVTCLVGGGYMVRLPQTGKDSDNQDYKILNAAASSFTPGQAVKVVDGVLEPITVGDVDAANAGADAAANAANIDDLTARGLIVGHVMAVNTADNTIDIFVN